jgi:uncharacterized protein (TIGR03000 family)
MNATRFAPQMAWCLLGVLAATAPTLAQGRPGMIGPTAYDLLRAYNGGRPPGPRFGLTPFSYRASLGAYGNPYRYHAPAPFRTAPSVYGYPVYVAYGGPAILYQTLPYIPPPPREAPALMSFEVPRDAEIYIDGGKSIQTGVYRSFTTPPIQPGKVETHEIKVRWMVKGKPVERTRKVELHPGDVLTFDYLRNPP